MIGLKSYMQEKILNLQKNNYDDIIGKDITKNMNLYYITYSKYKNMNK